MTGKRAAARERIEHEILAAARRQVADVGAAGLSVREVAREVGMVSSAVYRYVDSRDALLTRLIIDAYDALGAATERHSAAHAGAGDLDRWVATCEAIRTWALERPHDYLLLYGSPVPGYAAPDDTVIPGTRVTLALARIVTDAADAGRLGPASVGPVAEVIGDDLARLAELADLGLEPEHVAAFVVAWTQLFGLISFELTNQTRGMLTHHREFLALATRSTGSSMGLR